MRQSLGLLLEVRFCLERNLVGSVNRISGINLSGGVVSGLKVNLGCSVIGLTSMHLTTKTDRHIYIWSEGTTYTYR